MPRLARLVAAIVWCFACARGPMFERAVESDSSAESAATGASLEVENNSTSDVRVFVVYGGIPTRLGTVTGMTTASFALSARVLDREIRLYATPIGGRQRVRSDAFRVRAGQLVSWKLDDRLRSYRLSVY